MIIIWSYYFNISSKKYDNFRLELNSNCFDYAHSNYSMCIFSIMFNYLSFLVGWCTSKSNGFYGSSSSIGPFGTQKLWWPKVWVTDNRWVFKHSENLSTNVLLHVFLCCLPSWYVKGHCQDDQLLEWKMIASFSSDSIACLDWWGITKVDKRKLVSTHDTCLLLLSSG